MAGSDEAHSPTALKLVPSHLALLVGRSTKLHENMNCIVYAYPCCV